MRKLAFLLLRIGACALVLFGCGDVGGISGLPGHIPDKLALSISFEDIDPDEHQCQGTVTIQSASDLSNVTHYVLYWAKERFTKVDSAQALAEIPVSGIQVTYDLPENTDLPSDATRLMAVSKNEAGEMAMGTSVAVKDLVKIPANAPAALTFTDTDSSYKLIGGTVTITKAANETDVKRYLIYWGTDSTTKLALWANTPVLSITATGSDVTGTITTGTPIPDTATYLLSFSENSGGEMTTGAAVAIRDLKPTAPTPTMNSGGSFVKPQSIWLSSTLQGVKIYYTTNGSTPSSSSTLYSTPFTVSGYSTTVKAIAVGSEYEDSSVASSTYVINTLANLGYTLANSSTVSRSDGIFSSSTITLGTAFTQPTSSCPNYGSTVYRFYDGYAMVIDSTYYGIYSTSYWTDTLGCPASAL